MAYLSHVCPKIHIDSEHASQIGPVPNTDLEVSYVIKQKILGVIQQVVLCFCVCFHSEHLSIQSCQPSTNDQITPIS